MKLDEVADKWVGEFARELPGMFDHAEGVKCFKAGFRHGFVKGKKSLEAIDRFIDKALEDNQE